VTRRNMSEESLAVLEDNAEPAARRQAIPMRMVLSKSLRMLFGNPAGSHVDPDKVLPPPPPTPSPGPLTLSLRGFRRKGLAPSLLAPYHMPQTQPCGRRASSRTSESWCRAWGSGLYRWCTER
jgi:hypothetical protein